MALDVIGRVAAIILTTALKAAEKIEKSAVPCK
jgi:hypothetical protein